MVRSSYLEHPEDVLGQWLAWQAETDAALVMVTATEGGAVRAPGALMAVAGDGRSAGYLSGGCIDADVILHARGALEHGETKQLRYGAGSPFKDLPLPCGGAIEVTIVPKPDHALIQRCHETLVARRPATMRLDAPSGEITAQYRPKLRLRIAGRGADAIALAQLAQSSGLETELALRDSEDLDLARAAGLTHLTALQTPSDLPAMADDAWTAFVLMFHDGDWELPLLKQALAGPAFYVGAVGSAKTQARRRAALTDAGVHPQQIARIRGPVGLIPSMRDASMLAVSTLAEIVDTYHTAAPAPFASTALVLLAAGQSSRFEAGDKLLAELNGCPVIDHAAGALATEAVASRIAIVGPPHTERAERLHAASWQTLTNPSFEQGQGTSLATAIAALKGMPGVESALILLADMPNVPDSHHHALHEAMTPGVQAVFSSTHDVLGPPALFARETFDALSALTGDQGARAVFNTLNETRTVALAPEQARDIDRRADLTALETHTDG